MKILRYVRVALETIRTHPLRSTLTMLGIIIGVTSVVLTVGLGRGAAESINSDIAAEGTNLLTINAGFETQNRLTLADAAVLADPTLHPEIATVVAAHSVYGIRMVYEDMSLDVQVTGVGADLTKVSTLRLAQGRFLNREDEGAQRRVVVLSHTVAQALSPTTNLLGQTVRINDELLQIVGILQESGDSFGFSSDRQVFIPLNLALKRLFDIPRYRGDYTISEIKVQVADFEALQTAEYQIERTLRLRHNLQRQDQNDFMIINQARLLALANSISQTLTLLLGGIGAVSLLVGGIGIMNIMLVSVTERTREIGLRKAIGAQDHDILLQFLVEAVTLTLCGGTLGVLLSYTIGFLLRQISDIPFQIVIEVSVLALSLAVSMICGFLFGLYPAMRATRLDPIDALRYE